MPNPRIEPLKKVLGIDPNDEVAWFGLGKAYMDDGNFEEAAKEMQAKAEEKKVLLEQYEKMRLYGWQSHNLKSRTSALIRKYEQAVQSNVGEAALHLQIARKLERNNIRHKAALPFEMHSGVN